MKYLLVLIAFLPYSFNLSAQKVKSDKTRVVFGLAGPELLHVGVTHRVADVSQLGLSVGVGPSKGMAWTSINFEHRLYLGAHSERSNRKTWFFRQGTTFFPPETPPQKFTLTLTGGKDFLFKNPKNGITIDAGVFYLPDSDRSSLNLIKSLNLWPALRFQLYTTL